jgi:hypothetical protein
MLCPTLSLGLYSLTLKGPKHEIFESVFFYTNQRLMVKKIEISKVGVIILWFSPQISS